MRILKGVYTLAIAATLIALVVVGINAFYPAPEYPSCFERLGQAPDEDGPEYEVWWQQCREILEVYEQDLEVHNMNVFLIALPLGLVFAVLGAFTRRRMSIFGASLIVGGMGTMVFALTPYRLDDMPRFIGIAVILAALIFGGYKFFSALRKS